MSTRRVRIVLLCEDSQHEAFILRFLKGMGWKKRELRVEKSPAAGGSAEQWVRNRFPRELKAGRHYRQLNPGTPSAIIVMIDADNKQVQDRISEFEDACNRFEIPFRDKDEAVAIAVPKRNIETWIHYLNGNAVNEDDAYPKLDRERSCKTAVNRLVELCRTTGLEIGAPESLKTASQEYDRIRIRS